MTMRMSGLALIAISIFLGIPGCQHLENEPTAPTTPTKPIMSQVPVPSPYPISEQKKMQAIYHWEVLARDTADIIGARMRRTLPVYQEPIYVAPSGLTPFDKAFHDLLITSLVEKGLVVSHDYKNPLVVSFDTQIIAHKRVLEKTGGGFEPGLPEKEMMVTLSLTYKGAYLMRHSSIYYINDPEWWHYACKAEVADPATAVYTLVDK